MAVRTEPPTKAEELELFAGLPETRNAIILRYRYLIRSNLGSFVRAQHEDLEQEGFFGLAHAVEAFDPLMGYRFVTFAQILIRRSFFDWIYKRSRTVCIPVDVMKLMSRIRRGLPIDGKPGAIRRAYENLERQTTSLPDGWDPEARDPEPVERLSLACLTDREAYVIREYFYEHKLLRQIAAALGVTEARVGQIKTQALARLREEL